MEENKMKRKLDEMLDILLFYETNDSLLTFKKLCKYYYTINPEVTLEYIQLYKEQNAPEETKVGKRVDEEER